MQAQRHLIVLAIAALLGGCATAPANLSTAPVAAYRDSIQLTGRIFVNYQKDGQQQNLNGKFDWSQQPGRVDVSLSSQLDTTMAKISVTPQQATLTQAGQQALMAADIDKLTQRALGWSLPVSGLREWMQGYATDASGKQFTASPAHNTVTTKDGWRLRFVSWQDENAAHPVPKRIDAERGAALSGDEMSIKILIDPAA